MNQIIDFLFLRSDSLFDSFTIAQTIVRVLILVLDFIIWVAFRSLIPLIVSAVKKKPITKKGFRTLCIIISLFPIGAIYFSMLDNGASEAASTLFSLFCGACVYVTSFYFGIYILKRRGKLLEIK